MTFAAASLLLFPQIGYNITKWTIYTCKLLSYYKDCPKRQMSTYTHDSRETQTRSYINEYVT